MKIIPLSNCTFEQWLPLWQAYLEFYKSKLSSEQIILSWKRITNHEQADMFGYALMQNDKMIGFVHLISHNSTWTEKPYCYLQDLFIDHNFRNKGYARQLIEHVYAKCHGKFDRVYWLTHESNQDAQLLYDRIATKTGFIQYKKTL